MNNFSRDGLQRLQDLVRALRNASIRFLLHARPRSYEGGNATRTIMVQSFGALVLVGVFASLGLCQQATAPRTSVPVAPPTVTPQIRSPFNPGPKVGRLKGFVDLHTHPMANLGFGGKLLYGGVDVGSLLPADPDCKRVRATSEAEALGHDGSTHGGPGLSFSGIQNPCGNTVREQIIHILQQQLGATDPSGDAQGYPNFYDWPAWNDLTHQKMWVEWIRRAWQGGLRVMVALAVNNKTLGDVVTAGNLSSVPDLPTEDKQSADLQIDEIQAFVGRHSDFMEVAYSSADVYRIVSANKLAVVIGTEIDHIGNFQQVFYPEGLQTPPDQWPAAWAAAAAPPSPEAIMAEIDRLYTKGVRYIFPIHLLDNAFGGTATYQDLFNISTMRESGHAWSLVCAGPGEDINYAFSRIDFSQLGIPHFSVGLYPPCAQGGQKNQNGLTPSGFIAIETMMRFGMLIDIDHMSQMAADQTIALAARFGYPLNSGHNGLRGALPTNHNERALRADQYLKIANLHGMAGVGSANLDAAQWLKLYQQVIYAMGAPKGNPALQATYARDPREVEERESWAPIVVGGFGTDTDGLEFGMPPRPGAAGGLVAGPQYGQYQMCMASCKSDSLGRADKPGVTPAVYRSCNASCLKEFPKTYINVPTAVQYNGAFPASRDGNKTWNYNTDGVVHYGMLWDFLQDVRTLPGGADIIDNNFMYGADYFFRTWQIAETQSRNVK